MRPACHMSTIAFVRRAFSCGSAVHSTLSAAVTMSSPCTGSKIALSIPGGEAPEGGQRRGVRQPSGGGGSGGGGSAWAFSWHLRSL